MGRFKKHLGTIALALVCFSTSRASSQLGSSLGANLRYEAVSSLNREADRDASGMYYGSLGYAYKMRTGSWNLSAGFGYQQSYTTYGTPTQTSLGASIPQDQSGDWIDPRWSFTRSFTSTSVDSIVLGLKGTTYGVSKYSQLEGRRASIGPHFAVSEALSAWGMPWLTWFQKIDYRYFAFSDEIQDNGTVNRPHLILLTTIFSFEIGRGFSIGTEGGYLWTQSYQGVASTSITGGLELAYDYKGLTAAIGVSNGSNGLSLDGLRYEMNLLDADAASMYFALNWKI